MTTEKPQAPTGIRPRPARAESHDEWSVDAREGRARSRNSHRTLRFFRARHRPGVATIALVPGGARIESSRGARLATALALALAAALALALAAVDNGQAGAGAHRVGVAAAAGSPDRGRAVYLANGCAGCHGPPAPGSTASVGPQLTPELLRSSAQSAGKPLGPFVAESILVPNAFTSPGYVSGLMRPFAGLSKTQLDDLVSFLIGSSYTSPASGSIKLPARPVAACKADSACRATVVRWAKAERLPATALDGARIAAVAGCVSCHRYAGGGTRSGSAPELTRIGLTKLSTDALVKRLRCPTCLVAGSVMPSYAALGTANLRQIAEFLRASKGVKP